MPSVPTNVIATAGYQQVGLVWDAQSGATYIVNRSTDGTSYSQLATPTNPSYVDSAVTNGTKYWYTIQAVNGTTSAASTAVTATPVGQGQMTLSQLRTAAQQRADMVGDGFVSTAEWTSYVNLSLCELYDLLVTSYGDEYYTSTTPYQFTTDGVNNLFPLTGVSLLKLKGVDLQWNASPNGWITLKPFMFAERNKYSLPTYWSAAGRTNLRYRLVGNQLMLEPLPAAGQLVQVWYVPRPAPLVNDNDVADGYSGWLEYVIVDVAIKALQKEESDVSVLMAQKEALRHRIVSTAANRDEGAPQRVADVLGASFMDGFGSGDPFADEF